MTAKNPDSEQRPKGRPQTRVVKLDATPEEAARAVFSAVKQPDPTLRQKPPVCRTS